MPTADELAAVTLRLAALALVGCGASCPAWTVPALPAGSERVGELAVTAVLDADPARRWAVLAQARRDTDGDGRVLVQASWHGVYTGDQREPWLVEGTGPARRLDAWLGAHQQRWLAFVEDGIVVLRDVETGTERALGRTSSPRAAFVEDRIAWLESPRSLVVEPLDGSSAPTRVALDGSVWELVATQGSTWLVLSLLDHEVDEHDPSTYLRDMIVGARCSRLWGSLCTGPVERVAVLDVRAPRLIAVPGVEPAASAWGVVFAMDEDRLGVVRASGPIETLEPVCVGVSSLQPALELEAALIRCNGVGAHVLDDVAGSTWVGFFDGRAPLPLVEAAEWETPAEDARLQLFGRWLVDLSSGRVVYADTPTATCRPARDLGGPLGACARPPVGWRIERLSEDGSALLTRDAERSSEHCGVRPAEFVWATVEFELPQALAH